LAEIVVGAAIAAVLLWTLLALANRTIASAEALNVRLQATAGAAHLLERLDSEAASALAIGAPSSSEIDFTGQDASHRPYAWSYIYDAAAKTVTRYALESGSAPVAGEVVSQIDAFVATPVNASDLSNAASSAYDPLFAAVNAPDVAGNRLVMLQIIASGVNRRVFLANVDAPTAFTVVITYTPSPAPPATPTPAPLVMTP
jgi:hypothetical protein